MYSGYVTGIWWLYDSSMVVVCHLYGCWPVYDDFMTGVQWLFDCYMVVV